MTISTDDLGRITQETSVITADGDRLGTINQIYTSDTTGDPAWVTLKTGLFGTKESFVPLNDASFDGDDIRVPVTKDAVHGAPRVDAGGHLSPEEEDELYRYYGLHNPEQSEADAGLVGGRGDDRSSDDRTLGDRDDRSGGDDAWAGDRNGERAAEAGAGAGLGAGIGSALSGRDREDELASRDAEGRDEVTDGPVGVPRRAEPDDRTVSDEDGPAPVESSVGPASSGGQDEDAVRPGERTTRLRRYVVTERVVQTVEELPDDEPSR